MSFQILFSQIGRKLFIKNQRNQKKKKILFYVLKPHLKKISNKLKS